ncbi:MAG: OmpA family protein [Bacteroidetes bacterium]|nr:OmpA family protein [Bacteroidota bacterium]MCW5895463.1 OmpA family protein [Bacteroidota bacterium]
MNRLALIPLLAALSCVAFAQTDVTGSADHPLVTRYPGSTIGYYEQQNFVEYSIATGPVVSYKTIKDWKKVEGKLTRIYYIVKGTQTLNEVYGNYANAFRKSGFKELARGIKPTSGASNEIGSNIWLGTFYDKNPFPTGKNILLLAGSSTSAGSCYWAGELTTEKGTVFAVLGGHQYSADQKVFLLDIVEQSSMEDDLITVNADAILKGIRATGKFIIYGIYFDFDKADVKPESEPTLTEISKVLKSDPSLSLYVVGHTDMKGKLEYNVDLSKRRASAVVKELMTKYGIASNRLTPDGVGPLAPVATNETEEGRKKNRRVELVAK